MDNIKTWTGLSVEESIRMTEDRDKWIKYVHGVANLVNRTLVLEYFCRLGAVIFYLNFGPWVRITPTDLRL